MQYEVKRLSDYSKDNLLSELRRVAKLLGKDTLKQSEFEKHAHASTSVVWERFGSWKAALQEAGLASEPRKKKISDQELFAEIERVWNQLGRQPSKIEMRELGQFSLSAYDGHFGSLTRAFEAFVSWKSGSKSEGATHLEGTNSEVLSTESERPRRSRKVEFGEPIDFFGLRHAPLNEQGVVYLFGVLSQQLGFVIEAVRTDFPDCEGKRRVPGKQDRWEQVSIEFEYKSSNFKEHGHNPNECDVIICWKHDWKDCPLEVISLKDIYNSKQQISG